VFRISPVFLITIVFVRRNFDTDIDMRTQNKRPPLFKMSLVTAKSEWEQNWEVNLTLHCNWITGNREF